MMMMMAPTLIMMNRDVLAVLGSVAALGSVDVVGDTSIMTSDSFRW